MWRDNSLWIWFTFLLWLVMPNLSCYACWPCVHLLWRTVYFLIELFEFYCYYCIVRVPYILYIPHIVYISPLLDAWFANFLRCFFTLLIVCFDVQEFLSPKSSHLSVFAFDSTRGRIHRRSPGLSAAVSPMPPLLPWERTGGSSWAAANIWVPKYDPQATSPHVCFRVLHFSERLQESSA